MFMVAKSLLEVIGNGRSQKLAFLTLVQKVVLSKYIRQFDVAIISYLVYPYVISNIWMKIYNLQQIVKDQSAQTNSCRKVWYAKQKVFEKLFGTHESVKQKV